MHFTVFFSIQKTISCTFKGSEDNDSEQLSSAFHIVGKILEIRPVDNTKSVQIRVKFTYWTYQNKIKWKEVHTSEGIEVLAKILFQYAYQNNL